MTGWTLFFITVGVAFLTAQLFRLIDLIEHPARRSAARPLPRPRTLLLWNTLRELEWTFLKN